MKRKEECVESNIFLADLANVKLATAKKNGEKRGLKNYLYNSQKSSARPN